MAKALSPKERHTDKADVRKEPGRPGWTETVATGCDAARCCWFSQTLHPELYTNRWFLSHACLLHAEGDLGVLIAEQDVCYTRGWVARGAQMLAISQV